MAERDKEKLTQMQAAVQRTVELSFDTIRLQLSQGLRLGLRDTRLEITKCIQKSYCLWGENREELHTLAEREARTGSADLAMQAAGIAQELGAPIDPSVLATAVARRDAALCELFDLLPTAGREEAQETANALARIGVAHTWSGDHYEESVKALEQAWSLVQQFGLQSATISLYYGQVLSRFGKFEEAEKVMRQGLAGQQASAAAAALSNAIAEVRCQTGHWEDAATMCEWTLKTFAGCKLESVRAAYILADAFMSLEKPLDTLESWTRVVGNTECEAVRLCLVGEVKKDIEVYQLGAEQCQRLFPPSFLTANCLQRLGNQLSGLQAEQVYWRAQQIYRQHCPHSIHYAACMNSLGGLYQQQNRLAEAGQYHVQALHILALHHADTLAYISCLTSLGVLACAQRSTDQAEDLMQRAIKLCASFFPNSLAYAQCSAELAALYRSQSRNDLAIEHYLKSCQLYTIHSPDTIKHAECLIELGDVYVSVRKWREARDKYDKAAQLHSLLHRGSESHVASMCKLAKTLTALQQWSNAEAQYLAAVTLCETGSLAQAHCRELLSACYLKAQLTHKAEEQMKKACTVHLSHPSMLESCDFFARFGVFYKQLQRTKEAEEWFTKACDLYLSHHPLALTYSLCLANFALLYRQLYRLPEADQQLQLILDLGNSGTESIPACLVWLGSLCAQHSLQQSAEELWLWACERLQGETLLRARCLQGLGDLYGTERSTDSEDWYLQAIALYDGLPLSMEYARCLVSLAGLYEKKALKEAAAGQYQKAKRQFEVISLNAEASDCEKALRRLQGSD